MAKQLNIGFFCDTHKNFIEKIIHNLKNYDYVVEYFHFIDIFDYKSHKYESSIDILIILYDFPKLNEQIDEIIRLADVPIIVICNELSEFDTSVLIKKGVSLVFNCNTNERFAAEIDKLLKYKRSIGILHQENLSESEKASALEREITGILKEEGLLRESHIFLETILENIPSLIYVKDAKTMKYIYVNRSSTNMIEFTPDEMIGKTAYELFHPQYAEYYHSKDLELIKNNVFTQTLEEMCLTKNNRLKVFLTKKILIKDHKGEPRYFLGISEDLTQLYRSQEELLKSETRFTKIFHASPIAIFIISNKTHTFVDANIKCTEFYGINRDDAIGKSINEFAEFSDTEIYQTILNTLETECSFTNKEIKINIGNEQKYILLSCEQITFQDDSWSVFLSLDISERKRAEIEIQTALRKQQELNTLRTQFVSMISHEFRTPLTTILLSADMLSKYFDKLLPEERQKQINRIKETIQRMTSLLENVLTIGRIDSGKFSFSPKLCNLEELASNLVRNVEFNAGFSHKINLKVNGDCKEAYLDDNLISLAINNLLSNAIKYSPNSKNIDFTINCNSSEIEFIVTDYGIGIPDEEQKFLMQSFFRATNVGNISGYGLGLSIVKRALDAHQGKIEFKSKVGVGTTFIVRIPCQKPSNN